MDLRVLEDIGLSKGEVRVYMALLELGSTKTGPLAGQAGVSSSKVYKILARLQGKGLAGHVIKDRIKYFTAASPRRIVEYMEEKEKQLGEKKEFVKMLLPRLEKQQKMEPTRATVYEGFKAVTNVLRMILDDLGPGEEYYVLGATYGQVGPELRRFFYKHHQRRVARGIGVRMLANLNTKGNLEKTTRFKSQIRYLPQYFAAHSQIGVWKDKTALFVFTANPTVVVIESAEAAGNFFSYFRALWKIAKP